MEIPCTDAIDKNQICEVKIHNIYSPSRFWAVVNNANMKVFARYLTHYYKQKGVPLTEITKHAICVIHQKNNYYRAIILPVIFYGQDKIRAFLVDYGIFTHVTRADLFQIKPKHLKVPRLAFRCCLAYVHNKDKNQPWTVAALQTFCEILQTRKIFMKIHEIDEKQRTLYVDILRQCKNSLESCSTLLVSSGQALLNSYEANTEEKDPRYKRVMKYMHLFPTFQTLEGGEVPYSLWEHNLLKDCLPKDVLYKNYYEYVKIDDRNNK
ncbi:unnamed protein product [Acanthoscelides obtectus]|uniref:Tudor domain-containing protein n=1 Tax=Acanthoscelides obtectus TaxID=200917 RepID=A0A9P0MJS2_ACAOB|nr:unnamed protein product [Acanthoscelides obtectus]CAK1665946.1 Tudor domain-containing protein 6 [Acanthoscelides obtectus]